MSDLIRAAGLWAKTSVNGRKYLTGRLGGLRVLVFENPNRGEEGEPDFHLNVGDANANRPPETALAKRNRIAGEIADRRRGERDDGVDPALRERLDAGDRR